IADANATEARRQKKAAEDNAEEATRQKNAAVKNEAEAKRQEGIAKQQTVEAHRQRNEAEHQARMANSGQLAATAVLHKDDQLDLASLLSIEAGKTADTFEARNALLTTCEANPRLLTYLHHSDAVISVAFSPDHKTLASGSFDGTVRLWDVVSRQLLGQPLKGHNGAVRSVAFSPDGKTLASGSDDHTVRLWDVVSRQPRGEPLLAQNASVSVAFSPDGKTLASAGG